MKTPVAFETRITLLACLACLPALIALCFFVSEQDFSWSQWLMLALVVLVPCLLVLARVHAQVRFPLYTVSNLLEALREGDYSLRGSRARRGDAIGEVVWEINALSQTLREQRLRVEETVALLSKVLERIEIAIFTFDGEQQLRLINPAGERLLGIAHGSARGKSARDLGLEGCLDMQSLATLRRSFHGGSGPFELRRGQFRQDGRPHELIVLTDLSRALREEERAAWQRLIRVLGHELNNSLAPIKSMADTLAKLLKREPLAEDWREDANSGLVVIAERAAALNRFMAGYTTLARMPAPSRRQSSIRPLLERVARLEQRASVEIAEGPELSLAIDADQVEQALINLIRNGVEAALPETAPVLLRYALEGDSLVIEVLDQGAGLSGSDNLFVPFFTTKPGGSGIGLVLARQVAEAHGGSLMLRNREDRSGCIARLSLPAATA
jgi:nitrogen fixation/metabolism regulation signal transduction histidine kinase